MSGWDRIRVAGINAAVSPLTWVPAAGALAFQAGHADQKVSDWASSRTPVYGSKEKAGRVSDVLLGSSGGGAIASVLAAPVAALAGNIAADTGAGILMRQITTVVKTETGRTRPNGLGNVSFPSSHSAGTALYATLISRNLEYLNLSPAVTTASNAGLFGIAAATAWARVEAKQHYPSDVLAGAALGHFLGAFITGAFLGPATPTSITPVIEGSRTGFLITLQRSF